MSVKYAEVLKRLNILSSDYKELCKEDMGVIPNIPLIWSLKDSILFLDDVRIGLISDVILGNGTAVENGIHIPFRKGRLNIEIEWFDSNPCISSIAYVRPVLANYNDFSLDMELN